MPYTAQGPFLAGVGFTTWLHARGRSCNYPGPHVRGNERYASWFIPTAEATADLRVYRSADAGLTWASQDVAAMPSGGNLLVATHRMDADTIRICYPGGPPETAGLNVPAVRDFDCVTNTIGPLLFDCDPFAVLAPQIAGYHRNTVAGEDWVYAGTVVPVFFVGQQITLYRHNGVGFLAPIVVSDNVAVPQNKLCSLEAILHGPGGHGARDLQRAAASWAPEAPHLLLPSDRARPGS